MFQMPCSLRQCVIVIVAGMALGSCEKYPAAEDVASCAAARFGTRTGSFSVVEQPGSMLFGRQFSITYQKHESPDRAIITYDRRHGPVSTFQDISYGNHAEIKGAVDAIEYCAQATS